MRHRMNFENPFSVISVGEPSIKQWSEIGNPNKYYLIYPDFDWVEGGLRVIFTDSPRSFNLPIGWEIAS